MRKLLSLPPALLALIVSSSAIAADVEQPWPYNLPRTSKYYPEHEALVKRDLQAQEKLAQQKPIGMRKMSDDAGEKFFLDYWDFGEEVQDDSSGASGGNGNASMPLSQPLAEHFAQRSWPRALSHGIFARQWGSCPAGYQTCASVSRPDSCCAAEATCISVTDTGNGDVGCCPPGQNCGSTIAGCDAGAGQTECPGSGNGGCCISGYACFSVGCVFASTQTVVTTLPTATVTTGQQSSNVRTSSAAPPGTTVVGGAGAGGSVYTTTVTQVTTAPGSPDTTTILQPTTLTVTPATSPTSVIAGQGPLVCSASFTSCPASLGGGCCYTGYACGAVSCSGPTTSTSDEATALPPARPTTSPDTPVSQASVTSSPTSTAVITGDACPTGFYMCSAYYLGGCCRVGRDCDTTSCPSSASTEVASGTGVTVVAMTSTTTVGNGGTSAAAATQGSCANGFFACDAGQGGGCCPSGYLCGASCTATVSGVGNQPKTAPSEASVVRWAWSLGVLGVVSAVGMVCL